VRASTPDSGSESKTKGGAGESQSRAIVTLASGQSGPQGIAVDTTSVYWVNQGSAASLYQDGSVMKVSRSGGPTTTLASQQNGPRGIAVDPTNVYWTNDAAGNGSVGSVMRVPLSGGVTQALASYQAYPEGIVATESEVYWLSQIGLFQASGDGGAPRTVAVLSGSGPFGGYLVTDKASLYFIADGNLEKVPLGGGAVTTLASASGTTYGIAVDAENVYWATANSAAPGNENGAIMKVPLTGGTPVALATKLGMPTGLATDGASVYWVDPLQGVMKVALGGGAITTLTSDVSAPAFIAVDDTSVYWTNTDPSPLSSGNGGTVMKLTPK
jgi:sugar lactone lactonase YvrE